MVHGDAVRVSSHRGLGVGAVTTLTFVVHLTADHATDAEFEAYLGRIAARMEEVNMVASLRNRTAEFVVEMRPDELLAAVERVGSAGASD